MIAAYRFQLDRSEFLATKKSMAIAVVTDDMKMRGILLACSIIVSGLAMALTEPPLWGILVALLLFVAICSAWRRNDERLKFAAVTETEITVDADGVQERSAGGSKTWPWSSLRRIHDLPTMVILEFAGWAHVTMPNRLWSEARERSYFLQQVRSSAGPLLSDIEKPRIKASDIVLLIGSLTAGLDFGMVTKLLLYLRGFDLCSCAVRRSVVGRTADITIFLGVMVVIVLTVVGLSRLQKKRPRMALTIAILSIGLFLSFPLVAVIQRLT
jgi:hypothetical protein